MAFAHFLGIEIKSTLTQKKGRKIISYFKNAYKL